MTPAVVSGKTGWGGGGGMGDWERDEMSEGNNALFFSGEPLFWGERCRIKHLPTRKYLAVLNSEGPEGEYKVQLPCP